jgi:hypothetical protein
MGGAWRKSAALRAFVAPWAVATAGACGSPQLRRARDDEVAGSRRLRTFDEIAAAFAAGEAPNGVHRAARGKRPLMGLVDETPPLEDLPTSDAPVALTPAPASPPVRADWRAYATDVRSQGARPTCSAFAVVAGLEQLVRMTTGQVVDLSEEQLWARYGRGRWDAFRFATTDFLAPEAAWPYGGAAESGIDGAGVARLGRVERVLDAAQLRAAIVQRHAPVVLDLTAHEGFLETGEDGLVWPSGGAAVGGHAALVVGYADYAEVPGGGFLVLKNSWGRDWGDGGYGYLPFAYCAHQYCAALELASAELAPRGSR